jgi:hypothetical protein
LKVDLDGGSHYLIYSFARRMYVMNAFLQALNGLHDYALITNDEHAYSLYLTGLEAARKETPQSDTGAWSLYQLGGHESNLSYHLLLRDFLSDLCDNNREAVFCDTRDHFTAYTKQPPAITRLTARQKGRKLIVRFRLSKISRVSVGASKAGASYASHSATVGYGVRVFSLRAPRKKGLYRIAVAATDLAGNSARQTVKVRVKKTRH